MAVKHPRVNISFEAATAGLLSELAYQEHKSVAGLAKELILEALDRREDLALSNLAEIRDKPDVIQIKHEDVW